MLFLFSLGSVLSPRDLVNSRGQMEERENHECTKMARGSYPFLFDAGLR